MKGSKGHWLLAAICLGVVGGGIAGWNFPRLGFESAALLSRADIPPRSNLTASLRTPAAPAAAYLRGKLSDATRAALDSAPADRGVPDALLESLEIDLNRVLREESLWSLPSFEEAAKRDSLRVRIERGLAPDERIWINRMLLEAAFPGGIERNPLQSGEPVPGLASVNWIGRLWLNMLFCLVVPLVMASMVSGVANLGDVRRLGRTGTVTIVYFLATTGLAVLLGLILVNYIRPGAGVSLPAGLAIPEKVAAKREMGLSQIAESLITPNLFKAMTNLDLLPLIVFSLVFGAVLTTLGEAGRRVIQLADTVNEAVMKMVHLIMLLAPAGLFCLVASRIAEAGSERGIAMLLSSLGRYALTVVTGLAIHGFLFLPIILWALTGRNPFRYTAHFTQALITAFSTASSSATLPLTLECAEEKAGVPARSARFVIPLGATVNMNGTALYEAVAAMFIAQIVFPDHPLGLGDQALIFLTATLAAIGAAGIPEAGLVTMVIVLTAVHLPLEATALILPIDWLLDRFRTTINVWGDCVGAAVVEKYGFKDGAPAPAPGVFTGG